jgi:hypothetical protein
MLSSNGFLQNGYVTGIYTNSADEIWDQQIQIKKSYIMPNVALGLFDLKDLSARTEIDLRLICS